MLDRQVKCRKRKHFWKIIKCRLWLWHIFFYEFRYRWYGSYHYTLQMVWSRDLVYFFSLTTSSSSSSSERAHSLPLPINILKTNHWHNTSNLQELYHVMQNWLPRSVLNTIRGTWEYLNRFYLRSANLRI